MPNWCEGTLRVRGKMCNLKSFVEQSIFSTKTEFTDGVPIVKTTPLNMEVNTEAVSCSFSITEGVMDSYIRGTSRHFIRQDYIEIYSDSWDALETLCLQIQAAWGINAEQLLRLCREFSVDMRIYGFECGVGFNQDIEIIGGVITKNKEIQFADYLWDCICPDIGG
ncbi:MAG: hypothetical protein LUE17_05925 [Planctomycetaceae bacterium]|nr:hypothetical protein [Planctomycetaceae bacterium]